MTLRRVAFALTAVLTMAATPAFAASATPTPKATTHKVATATPKKSTVKKTVTPKASAAAKKLVSTKKALTPKKTVTPKKSAVTKKSATVKKSTTLKKSTTIRKSTTVRKAAPIRKVAPTSPKVNWPPQGFKAVGSAYARVPTGTELVGILSAMKNSSEPVNSCSIDPAKPTAPAFSCAAILVGATERCTWWKVSSTITGIDPSNAANRVTIGDITVLQPGAAGKTIQTIFLVSPVPLQTGVMFGGIHATCGIGPTTDQVPSSTFTPDPSYTPAPTATPSPSPSNS